MHAFGILHRDVRWAYVLHAFPTNNNGGLGNDVDMLPEITLENELDRSNEWVLFDFEFAAFGSQPPFAKHTLTPGNHALEMVLHEASKVTRNTAKNAPSMVVPWISGV